MGVVVGTVRKLTQQERAQLRAALGAVECMRTADDRQLKIFNGGGYDFG